MQRIIFANFIQKGNCACHKGNQEITLALFMKLKLN